MATENQPLRSRGRHSERGPLPGLRADGNASPDHQKRAIYAYYGGHYDSDPYKFYMKAVLAYAEQVRMYLQDHPIESAVALAVEAPAVQATIAVAPAAAALPGYLLRAPSGRELMTCVECGREIEPAGQTLTQLPGGFVCQDCDRKRRDLERRAKRDWMQVLWGGSPAFTLDRCGAIVILVLMGLLHFLEF